MDSDRNEPEPPAPKCSRCNVWLVGVEYHVSIPAHYDGTSEWRCLKCGRRTGRWSGKQLAEGEREWPPWRNTDG